MKNNVKKDFITNKIKKYYIKKSKDKKLKNKYESRSKEDIMVRITNSISCRIYKYLKKTNIMKTFKYNSLLGCSLNELKIYIQENFKENMNFNNYGD